MHKRLPSEQHLRRRHGNSSGWMVIPAKFNLGSLRLTPRAGDCISGLEIGRALTMHGKGDWGNVSTKAWEDNDRAMMEGGELLSEYCTNAGVRFLMLTHANRRHTTVLLPEEQAEFVSNKQDQV